MLMWRWAPSPVSPEPALSEVEGAKPGGPQTKSNRIAFWQSVRSHPPPRSRFPNQPATRYGHPRRVISPEYPLRPILELPSLSRSYRRLDRLGRPFRRWFGPATLSLRSDDHLHAYRPTGWHCHRNRDQQPRRHQLLTHLQRVLRLRHKRATHHDRSERRLLRRMVGSMQRNEYLYPHDAGK